MRFLSFRRLALVALAFSSCHPTGYPQYTPAPYLHPRKPHAAPAHTTPQPITTNPHQPTPASPPRCSQADLADVSFQFVSFDSRSHRLVVADQPDGPGSLWADSEAVGCSTHALAAVNGGFFTPEGKPLGRVISRGIAAGTWNRSSLGSGAWVAQTNGTTAILRRDTARILPESGISALLQAGPMLVENGRAVSGLDPVKSSPRTFLAWDGGTGWVLAHADSCTLAALSSALAGRELGGVRVQAALNLDGGRSAEFWVSPSVPGGPRFLRPFWNKPVRNFVLLYAR